MPVVQVDLFILQIESWCAVGQSLPRPLIAYLCYRVQNKVWTQVLTKHKFQFQKQSPLIKAANRTSSNLFPALILLLQENYTSTCNSIQVSVPEHR